MSDTRSQQWAISYDISIDKERSRIEKTLKGWGHRAQKSVFLVTTTRSGIHTLRRELDAHRITSGTVLLLRLQANVQPLAIGEPWEHPDEGTAYVFLSTAPGQASIHAAWVYPLWKSAGLRSCPHGYDISPLQCQHWCGLQRARGSKEHPNRFGL